MINLIKHIYFNTFYLYAKYLEEPYYDLLQDICNGEKIRNEFKSFFSSDIENIIDVDELDRTKQNLIVFVDFVTENNQMKIIDLFKHERKINAPMVYISQSWYQIPKTLRLQRNYLALFPSCDNRHVNLIFKEKGIYSVREYFTKSI